jgi:hypothetical protein
MAVTERVPITTPMYDDGGRITRPWILFWEKVAQRGRGGGDGSGLPGYVNVKDRGAKGDAKRLRISITEDSATITAEGGGLLGLVGKPIAISYGIFSETEGSLMVTTTGGRFKSTIVSVESDTSATLADTAPVTAVAHAWPNAIAGTDDSAAIQAVLDSVDDTGIVAYFPSGNYLLLDDGLVIDQWKVRLMGLSTQASWLCYAGDGTAVQFRKDESPGVFHDYLEHLMVDITCAGAAAYGVEVGPSHYCGMEHCWINSQSMFIPEDMEQVGLVLDGGGYSGSFGAGFHWKDNIIKGRFKRGLWLKAEVTGFGYNACTFYQGTVIWESLNGPILPSPAGYGYYGIHHEHGNQNLFEMIDSEEWDVGWYLESYDNLYVGIRSEFSRTKGIIFAAVTLNEELAYVKGGTFCRLIGSFSSDGVEEQTGTTQIWAALVDGQNTNVIRGYAFLDTTLSVDRDYPIIWSGSSGSSALIWRDEPDGPGVGNVGVFGDKKLNLYAGLSQVLECAGSIEEDSSTLALSVYPGQTVAVEPTEDDIGKRIVVERALDGRKALITTITGVTATPATHTLGTISIVTETTTITNGAGEEEEVTTTTLTGAATYWTIALNGKTITVNGDDYTFQYASPNRGFIVEAEDYGAEHADEAGASYSIAYDTYELTLADAAGATLNDISVKYATAADFIAQYDKSIALKAHGTIAFQIASINKLTLDTAGFTVYAPIKIIGNQGIGWNTLGGSSGLSWQISHETEISTPYIHGLLINAEDAMELRAGESRVDKDLILEAAHEDAQIQLRVGGVAHMVITADGVSGTMTAISVGGNNNFSNVTASEYVRILAASPPPLFITRNTDATSKVGGLDMGWNSARQWLFSAGVPSSTNTAFALTEYTDDSFVAVRLMAFKGGAIVIGSTTDDGANILQVTGNAKITGSLNVTDASTTRTNLGVDAAPTVTPGSVTLLKLTGGGSDGSLTISATGRVTAYTAPT